MNRLLFLAALVFVTGCDLTVDNPNASTFEDIEDSRDGLIAYANGVQRSYAVSALDNIVLTPGVTARELAINRTFANLIDLEAGGSDLPTDNGNVTGLFTTLYSVAFDAGVLIETAGASDAVEDDLQSGLVALGQFYRAAAFGALAQSFTQVSLNPGAPGGATYVDRDEALAEAVRLMAEAEQGAQAASGNEAFQDLLPAGFDLVNSARAYRARFALFAGDYATAISAADAVDLGATSTFAYSSLAPNPIYSAFYVGTPSYAVRDGLGLASIQDGDGRVDFYTDTTSVVSDPNGLAIDVAAGFFDDGLAAPLPVYLPDEIRLIRAEAIVRSGGDLDEAVEEINAVRTDTDDPFGVNAGLEEYDGAVTADALLAEIYYNRAAELFLQGLRFEDARRFGRPGPSSDPFQRNRDFYPFPDQERQENPNTPPNPSV